MKNKKIIRGSIIFLIALGTLFSVSLILSLVYKDKIIHLVTSKMNEHLVTEIKVEKIDFSMIKSFPFAAVNFHEAQARSTNDFEKSHFSVNSDTLFHFEKISFKFNPFDLIRKKYRVKNIAFSNGKVNLLADHNGKVNYIFWKRNENQNSDNQLTLGLENVILKNVNVVYNNASKSFYLDVHADRGKAKGNYRDNLLTLDANADLFFNHLSVKNTQYAISEYVNVTTTLSIGKDNVVVENGKIRTNSLEFQAGGKIITDGHTDVQLEITGNDLDIVSFISVLPGTVKEKFGDYKSAGGLDMHITIAGIVSHRQQPLLNADFSIRNGTIQKNKSRVALDNVSLTGSFTNGDKRQLASANVELHSIQASLNGNKLYGSFRLTNFLNPSFKTAFKGDIDLTEFHEFLSFDPVKKVSGTAKINLEITGNRHTSGRISKEEAARWTYIGEIAFYDAYVEPSKGPFIYQNIHGLISLDRKNIHFRKFRLNAGENDLLISGSFHNGIPYMIGSDEKARIEGDIQSNYLNLTSLAIEQEKTSAKNQKSAAEEESSPVQFPDNLEITGNFMVKEFIFKKFIARNARGKLKYQPRTLILNSVYFDALNGSVSGGGAIAQRLNKDFTVRAQTQLNNINISDLFTSFNNFGQQVLLAEHVNGSLQGFINFSADWDVNLKVYKPSIACESDFKIYDGELIDFTPLLGLSKFIKVSELQHIKFSTLENKVKIADESVIIPQMDIQSSAFNIACSGVHHFDNNYDYKVQLLLSEVLSSKRDTRQTIVTEFGEIERDNYGRTKLYLSISGKGSDYHVGYDFTGTKKALKKNLKEEKKELKTILHDEFGWFGKDSSQQKSTSNQEKKPAFIWGDEDRDTIDAIKSPDKKNGKVEETSTRPKFKWDEEVE